MNTKNWWENWAKKFKNKLKLSSLFSFLNKVRNSLWNFLQNISNITQISKGGKFKSRLVSHSYLTLVYSDNFKKESTLEIKVFFILKWKINRRIPLIFEIEIWPRKSELFCIWPSFHNDLKAQTFLFMAITYHRSLALLSNHSTLGKIFSVTLTSCLHLLLPL